MRRPAGLFSTILVRTLPVALLLLLGIWYGASMLANHTVRQQVEERLQSEALDLAEAVAASIGSLEATTRTLAGNDLVVNGVIDTLSRQFYLEPMFRSLRLPGFASSARITMTDFQGRFIATNGESASFEGADWVDDVMSGQHLVELSPDGLRIAAPILYSGLPEGMVSVELDSAAVAEMLLGWSVSSEYVVLGPTGEVVLSTDAGIAQPGDPDPGGGIDGWIEQRAAVPGFAGLAVILAQPEELALGPASRLQQFLLAAMGLDVLVLAAGIGMTARSATRPVSDLVGRVRAIRGVEGLNERVPEAGPRELRQLGLAFNETFDELQRTMSDRIQAEVENARLQSEVESKTEMEERMRTFVSLASHELRTPATSILGFSELLVGGDESEATRTDWLDRIQRNSHRLTGIVDALLDISRIQTGTQAVGQEEIALPSVVEAALADIRPTTDKHEFVVDLAPGMRPAIGDPDKLAQVLTNLVENAVKYSPNGGTVTIFAAREPERERLVVGVRDEGMGITPEDRHLLFTPFGRIQRPETQGILGSGLGLYMVKQLVEAHRGEAWMESHEGPGATFCFSLPTASSPEAPGRSHHEGDQRIAVSADRG